MLSRLDPDEIMCGDTTWCRRWLRICGIIPEQGTRIQPLREQVVELRDMAVRGEPIPVVGASNPLPWMLTSRAKTIVNQRVAGISYPHATPTCSQGPDSFIKRTGCWRTASKLLVDIGAYTDVHAPATPPHHVPHHHIASHITTTSPPTPLHRPQTITLPTTPPPHHHAITSLPSHNIT